MLRILSRSGGYLKDYLPNCTTDFGAFSRWMDKLRLSFISHDLETTVSNSVLDREILVAAYHYEGESWVIFIPELLPNEFEQLLDLMQKGRFIIQNVKFEYQMWKKHGVMLNNFHDTFLHEKLMCMGFDDAGYGLSDITNKYLGIKLDKELQKSFHDTTTITDNQLDYALSDVLHLNLVKREQLADMKVHDDKFHSIIKGTRRPNRGVKKASWWTHEFIKVLSDMEFRGICLNREKWVKLYEKALPLVNDACKHLDSIVARDFKTRAIAAGYLYDKDTPVDKLFTSSAKKLALLQILFPELDNTSNDSLRRFLKATDPDWPAEAQSHNSKKADVYINTLSENKYAIIKLILLGKLNEVWGFFLVNFREELLKRKLLHPEGNISINWASPPQRTEIFRWIVPGLESTDKEHMEEVAYRHELLSAYLDEYQGAVGKVTKFGLNYIKHIQEDGRIRTNIDPVLNTGRISSSKPNVLNIINDPEYRAAFEPAPGYKFVMSDYQSEELVLTAFMSKEPVWLDALNKGHDLHSVNAHRIFPILWDKGKEPGCKFEIDSSRCKCKAHGKLRSRAKTSGFGIIYGITKHGLAWKIKDTEQAAQDTIDGFYGVYPRIKSYFQNIGKFALNHGYTPEAGFGTARFFDKRKIHYAKESILRTAGNFTIQGLGAAILKVCTVLIRRHIIHMKHDAHIVLTPYDEIIMEVKEDIAEYWKDKLKYYMELAGKLVLGTDILKADEPKIGDYWIH